MHPENLADLPEALPLKRVSSVWRVLTFISAAAILLLLFAVGSLFLLVLRQGRELASAQSKAPFLVPPPVAVPINPGGPDDVPPANAANLPYPVQEDLRPVRVAQPLEAPNPGNSPRARFLARSREFWKAPSSHIVHDLTVSPDGQSIAYFKDQQLVAGLMANPLLVEEPEAPAPWTTRPAPGRAVFPPVPVKQPAHTGPEARLVGIPAWSADSRYVFFGSMDGRMKRYDAQAKSLETLPFRGSHPAPLPNDSQRIVFVRYQSVPKSDAPGATTAADLAEIVIGDCSVPPREPRLQVVVPARALDYGCPAISGDGRRLTIWARRPSAGVNSGEARVLLFDLTKPAAEPETLDIPATHSPGPLCWTKDGKHLVYARVQHHPLPPDCWNDMPGSGPQPIDLFQWDLAAKTETRLSRGGGFASPSLDRDGNLFYLTAATNGAGWNDRLRRVPLAAAREFAGAEPELPRRDAFAWTSLIDQVWQDAKAPAGPKTPLTADLMVRLAASLERGFTLRFKEPLPTRLDRLEQETAALLPAHIQRRWKIILVAARGEHLRRTQSAVWHLVDEPAPEVRSKVIENDNPFTYVVDLFAFGNRTADDDEAVDVSLPDWLLQQAEGRTLVLTNDARAAQEAAAKLVDPDLASGADLLKQGQPKEGEKLLDELLGRPQHQRNYHLGLAVGQLFYEHRRFETLHRLMEGQCIQQPADARKFNLLGLALLERQPREAAGAFKKAIRCDLSYGPGYLNLAQAYRLSNDTPSAVACLRRYLEIQSFGPQAADAARRLAALEAENR
jgi:tetratricopeptide (TPR) repeat protein